MYGIRADCGKRWPAPLTSNPDNIIFPLDAQDEGRENTSNMSRVPIAGKRRDLDDTLDLIERLRVNCTSIKAKLEAAEASTRCYSKGAERL